jgi:hypothetical protein
MTEVTKVKVKVKVKVRVRVRAGLIASRDPELQLVISALFHLPTCMLVPCVFLIGIPRVGRPWVGQKIKCIGIENLYFLVCYKTSPYEITSETNQNFAMSIRHTIVLHPTCDYYNGS